MFVPQDGLLIWVVEGGGGGGGALDFFEYAFKVFGVFIDLDCE